MRHVLFSLTTLMTLMIPLRSWSVQNNEIKTTQQAEGLVNRIISDYYNDAITEWAMPLTAEIRWDKDLAAYTTSGKPEIANGTAKILDKNGHAVSIKSKKAHSLHIDIRISSQLPHLLNEDALAAIVCHEIGHFLGGKPKYGPWMKSINSNVVGMTVEGEADYFAAKECLPRIFGKTDTIEQTSQIVIPEIRSGCSKRFKNEKKSAVCQRITMAGFSMLQALTNLEQPKNFRFAGEEGEEELVSFDKHDKEKVLWTDWYHPKNQCRLDTFKKGALRKSRPGCWRGLTLFGNV